MLINYAHSDWLRVSARDLFIEHDIMLPHSNKCRISVTKIYVQLSVICLCACVFVCMCVCVRVCVCVRMCVSSYSVPRRDLLHDELGQRGDALVWSVLPQTLAEEALEAQELLTQPQRDAEEAPGVLDRTANDLLMVLGCKQMLERERERKRERESISSERVTAHSVWNQL